MLFRNEKTNKVSREECERSTSCSLSNQTTGEKNIKQKGSPKRTGLQSPSAGFEISLARKAGNFVARHASGIPKSFRWTADGVHMYTITMIKDND
jgi:hypothetical protein